MSAKAGQVVSGEASEEEEEQPQEQEQEHETLEPSLEVVEDASGDDELTTAVEEQREREAQSTATAQSHVVSGEDEVG